MTTPLFHSPASRPYLDGFVRFISRSFFQDHCINWLSKDVNCWLLNGVAACATLAPHHLGAFSSNKPLPLVPTALMTLSLSLQQWWTRFTFYPLKQNAKQRHHLFRRDLLHHCIFAASKQIVEHPSLGIRHVPKNAKKVATCALRFFLCMLAFPLYSQLCSSPVKINTVAMMVLADLSIDFLYETVPQLSP